MDLVSRIPLREPRRIIDIGCGTGNSTAVLRSMWPTAEIWGLDSSPSMIERARSSDPEVSWVLADASGDLSAMGGFDIVFSNAALQWIPDHERLIGSLFAMVNPGGVLAVQVPYGGRMPTHLVAQDMIQSPRWRDEFADFEESYSRLSAEEYDDLLCSVSSNVDLWETRYFHVMATCHDIVSWYSSTGLRIYLDHLGTDERRADFLADYEQALGSAYPPRADGMYSFPFTRVFFVARRD